MNSIESILFWSSTLFIAVTFFLTLSSIIFKKDSLFDKAKYTLFISFLLLTAFGIIRWVETSHPPFVTQFESLFSSIWFVLLILLILIFVNKRTTILIMPVSAILFLLLGWSSSMTTEASELSSALTNVWLFIHASFATCGAASFVIGASFSILYLMGEEKINSIQFLKNKAPEYNKFQKIILNFLIFGLILWGVMIVSGSIWAHIAWGRYWAWDPIETWSLISWLLYGLVIHTKLTTKLSSKTFSWLTIIAALTVVFSLWGVGYVYETIHNYG